MHCATATIQAHLAVYNVEFHNDVHNEILALHMDLPFECFFQGQAQKPVIHTVSQTVAQCLQRFSISCEAGLGTSGKHQILNVS